MKKIQPMDVKANGHYSQGGTGGADMQAARVRCGIWTRY